MSKESFCPECGYKIEADWKACVKCNRLLVPQAVTCSRCFQIIVADDPTF